MQEEFHVRNEKNQSRKGYSFEIRIPRQAARSYYRGPTWFARLRNTAIGQSGAGMSRFRRTSRPVPRRACQNHLHYGTSWIKHSEDSGSRIMYWYCWESERTKLLGRKRPKKRIYRWNKSKNIVKLPIPNIAKSNESHTPNSNREAMAHTRSYRE